MLLFHNDLLATDNVDALLQLADALACNVVDSTCLSSGLDSVDSSGSCRNSSTDDGHLSLGIGFGSYPIGLAVDEHLGHRLVCRGNDSSTGSDSSVSTALLNDIEAQPALNGILVGVVVADEVEVLPINDG